MTSTPPRSARPFDARRNVRLLNTLNFVTQFNPVFVIWVVYLTDYRDLSLAQVGIMEGLFWGVKLVLEIPSGAFADRYGRRLCNIVGVTGEGLGMLAFAVAGNFWLLLFSYVLWAGALAFRSGNDDAYLYDSLAFDGRQEEYGDRVGVFRSFGIVAFSIGGVVGGVLAATTNLQVGILSGVAGYVCAGVVLIFMQEPPRVTVTAMPSSYLATLRTALRALRRDPGLRWMIALEVALSATFPAHFLLAQPFLGAHHVDLALYGVLEVPARVAGVAALLLAGRWIAMAGMARGLIVSISLVVVGLLVLAGVDHVAAFGGFALLQVGTGLAMPAMSVYVNQRTSSEVRATILSVAPLGTSLAYVLVAPVVGVVGDASLQLAFGISAAMIAVSCGLIWMVWRRSELVAAAR